MTSASRAVRTTFGETCRVERGVDDGAASKARIVGDDREASDVLECQRLHLAERMPLAHEHHAVPLVARKRHQLREVRERFGGDAQIDFAARSLVGHLLRIPLVQDELDLRVLCCKLAQDFRQYVPRLRVCRCDRKRAAILGAEFRCDAL